MRIYHGQAFLDCDVDGDNDSRTCVSDFQVVDSFPIDSGLLLAVAMLVSAIFAVAKFSKSKLHSYSVIRYYDSMITSPMFLVIVATISGTQEMSTLAAILMNSFMVEGGIYVHDMGYWNSRADKKYLQWHRLIVLHLLSIVNWSIVVGLMIEYAVESTLPVFIPFLSIFGLVYTILLRLTHYKYFYGTLSGHLKKMMVLNNVDDEDDDPEDDNENSMFKKKKHSFYTKYEIIKKESGDPEVIDFGETWPNLLSTVYKFLLCLVFYLGTNSVEIYYK